MRQTVCPQPVDTQTSYISWNDAEQAASVGAPCESPHKQGTPADREWVRFYNRAVQCLRISGVTGAGYRRVSAS